MIENKFSTHSKAALTNAVQEAATRILSEIHCPVAESVQHLQMFLTGGSTSCEATLALDLYLVEEILKAVLDGMTPAQVATL